MQNLFDQDNYVQDMGGCTDCHGTCSRTCARTCHGSGHRCFETFSDIN